jgi:HEAT repeat protein
MTDAGPFQPHKAMIMKTYAMLLALFCSCSQASFGDEWQDLAKYTAGNSKAAQVAETLLQKTPVEQHGAIETALIALVANKDATQDGKAEACRMLQQIGTEKCIPAVAGLLQDAILSDYARLVLQRLASEQADEAMRSALGRAPDQAKIGILGSLGERQDRKAVKDIAPLATHSDVALAAAAIHALGRIGGEEAAKCLRALTPAEKLIPVHMVALVDCARNCTGNEAVSLYEQVLAGKTLHRVSALSGLLTIDEKKATTLMIGFIKGEDAQMRSGVLALIGNDRNAHLTQALVNELKTLPDDRKAGLITALGIRGDKAALDSIVACLASTNEHVRAAALTSAWKIGDAGTATILLGLGADGVKAIAKMPDSSVNEVLVKALDDSKLRTVAIEALVARNCFSGSGKLFELLNNSEAQVRTAAWSGLGVLAVDEDMERLAKVVFSLKDEAEQAHGFDAARNVCARAKNRAACFDVIATYYDGATSNAQLGIIDIASIAGSPSALAVVKKALTSGDQNKRGKAVRSLAAWVNDSAAGELATLAKDAPEETERILALRGYIRIAGTATDLQDDKRAEMFKTAAELAKRADEKKLIIGSIRTTQHISAIALVSGYLNDPDVSSEAELAAIAFIEKSRKRGPTAEIKALAGKLLNSKNQQIVEKAKKFQTEFGQ